MHRNPLVCAILTNFYLLSVAGISAHATEGAGDLSNPIRIDTEFLADDLLEGRGTAERGGDIAAAYLAARLDGMGISPVFDDWFQPVPFVRREAAGNYEPKLTIDGVAMSGGFDVRSGIVGPLKLQGDVVFIGNGVLGGDRGIDDLAALDLRGKYAVMVLPSPDKKGPAASASVDTLQKKFGIAGAVLLRADGGVVDPIRAKPPQPLLVKGWDLESSSALDPLQYIMIDATVAERLFAGTTMPWPRVQKRLADGQALPAFDLNKSIEVEAGIDERRSISPNVLGRIVGSDPRYADEYVLVTAHYDHEGVERGGTWVDPIFNGALDNAVGVSVMLDVASRLSKSSKKPKRTIVFAAVTGEEKGLLGSEYLAQHLPFEGKRPIAVVNIDMPLLTYDFTDVIAFGQDHSTLGSLVSRVAVKNGIRSSPEPQEWAGLFDRSDQASFTKQGVPSIFIMPGFENGGRQVFETFMKDRYHTPSDDMSQQISWPAAARFAHLIAEVVSELATARPAPTWLEGSPYAGRF